MITEKLAIQDKCNLLMDCCILCVTFSRLTNKTHTTFACPSTLPESLQEIT